MLVDLKRDWMHTKHADSLENIMILGKIEGRRRNRRQRMRCLYGITKLMDMSLSKLWELVMGKEAWHVAVHRVAKNWTWLSEPNWSDNSLPCSKTVCGYWLEKPAHHYFLIIFRNCCSLSFMGQRLIKTSRLWSLNTYSCIQKASRWHFLPRELDS